MTYESYIKAHLVTLIMDEAYHTGSTDTMLAIAQVIANRVKAGWQGGDWVSVIRAADKVRGTAIMPGHAEPDSRDPQFRNVLRQIDDIYHGVADDSSVNGEDGSVALYYAILHDVNCQWFKDKILSDLESHPRLANVGEFTFFG